MLKEKIAIVTGAAKGIGKGIALALAQEGANVVLTDIDVAANEAAAAEIASQTGVQCVAMTCDVSKKADVDAVVSETVKKFGALDIMVHNAGIYPFKPFMELSEADWDKVLDVNLKSTFLTNQAASRVMNPGGKIVNISSIAAFVGFEGLTHYCASKGGMNGMIRALALELAPKKINVNAVAPGAIQTPGASGAIESDAMKQVIAAIPCKRVGKPADIANAVVFLSSDKADYITGQALIVDGGWTLR